MNTGILSSVQVLIFNPFGYIPRSGIARSCESHLFSKVVTLFYVPLAIYESSSFSTSSLTLVILCVFNYSRLNGCEVASCGLYLLFFEKFKFHPVLAEPRYIYLEHPSISLPIFLLSHSFLFWLGFNNSFRFPENWAESTELPYTLFFYPQFPLLVTFLVESTWVWYICYNQWSSIDILLLTKAPIVH